MINMISFKNLYISHFKYYNQAGDSFVKTQIQIHKGLWPDPTRFDDLNRCCLGVFIVIFIVAVIMVLRGWG